MKTMEYSTKKYATFMPSDLREKAWHKTVTCCHAGGYFFSFYIGWTTQWSNTFTQKDFYFTFNSVFLVHFQLYPGESQACES